jgi:hypothetical protein
MPLTSNLPILPPSNTPSNLTPAQLAFIEETDVRMRFRGLPSYRDLLAAAHTLSRAVLDADIDHPQHMALRTHAWDVCEIVCLAQ